MSGMRGRTSSYRRRKQITGQSALLLEQLICQDKIRSVSTSQCRFSAAASFSVKCLCRFSKIYLEHKGYKSLGSCESNSACFFATLVVVSLALHLRVWLVCTACNGMILQKEVSSHGIKYTCKNVTLE